VLVIYDSLSTFSWWPSIFSNCEWSKFADAIVFDQQLSASNLRTSSKKWLPLICAKSQWRAGVSSHSAISLFFSQCHIAKCHLTSILGGLSHALTSKAERERLSASFSLFLFFADIYISLVVSSVSLRTQWQIGVIPRSVRHACINYERDDFYGRGECTRGTIQSSILLLVGRMQSEIFRRVARAAQKRPGR
jgi:hypothetical protein